MEAKKKTTNTDPAAESWAEVPELVDRRPANMETTIYGISRAIQGNEVVVDCGVSIGGPEIGMIKLEFANRDEAWAAYCKGLRFLIKIVDHPERPVEL